MTSLIHKQDPSRPHAIAKAPNVYSFDRVFAPPTSQSSFFTSTTLPLVEKLLQGENGLLFAYGVSNSGKSYTISGGQTEEAEERGLLPRSIDVVFNSIDGLQSGLHVRVLVLLLALLLILSHDSFVALVPPMLRL